MTLHFFTHLLQLIIYPGNGWEDIEKADANPDDLMSHGLYPLLGLTAISAFVQWFYESRLDLVALLCRALVVFVAFFITCWIAPSILSMTLRNATQDYELEDRRVHTLVIYTLAVMALIQIITNCLPVEVSVLQLLPLYIAIILWKGGRYLDISNQKIGLYVVIGFLLLVCLPLLAMWVFGLAIK